MDSVEGPRGWFSSLSRNDVLLALATSMIAFFILHAIGTVVYNVYFHPLSRYPGPLAAACTNLTYWSANITGDLLPWIQSVHQQYGEVVRLGPNLLSYTNPDAWKDIYGHRIGTKTKSNTKDVLHYPPDLNGRYSINALGSDDEHGRVRRIFSHAFSDRALKEQEPLIASFADHLVAHLRKNATAAAAAPAPAPAPAPLDLFKLLTCTTMDIMSDLSFGQPLGLLDTAEFTPWVAAIFSWIKLFDLSRITLEYPILGHLARWLTPQALLDDQELHNRSVRDRVDLRLQRADADDDEQKQHPDMWHYVLKQPEGRRLDREDMYTRVAVAQYTAYRSPLYFKDPEKFIPERWLPGTGYDDDRRDVVQAFSYGPRNCIGKNLAYHEMRVILAKMLWNFDFEVCPESEGWINQKSYTLWQKNPLWVKARSIR
ncbi:putative cytochrome p450 [Diplodia seriata]|uniref:Putative cytochrome p450 n=1 Tax=Diplodia seriata TaxID=420778 RepID=A0A0G2GCK8_9PEZI|nr:putative cytochrome p450 [Diplodia seriata]